jgi:hypothetical protein
MTRPDTPRRFLQATPFFSHHARELLHGQFVALEKPGPEKIW